MQMRLIAGNWKMNGTSDSLREITPVIEATMEFHSAVLICTPFTLIDRAITHVRGSRVTIGAQDCHPEAKGPHTGDVSAQMLAEIGATHVITGHSERRQNHRETNALVRAKATAALDAGLVPIVCVGETQRDRDAGNALDIVSGQVRESLPAVPQSGSIVVAYEPVWAIGTGRIPALGDIAEMHTHIRRLLIEEIPGSHGGRQAPILYGGSITAKNAAEIFSAANVDGGLVGGASLRASDFLPICRILEQA